MNIMLIDDEAAALECLQSVLEQFSHDCAVFEKPEEAVSEYRNRKYDVVITDMRMPGMSGIQVLKNIRMINPEAKVIILTAFLDAETAISASSNHVYALFNKPLNITSLMETLQKIEEQNEKFAYTPQPAQQLIPAFSTF